ncbi:MAG TPA: SPW repeat protein [Candidatus Udaeobacter sp.]|nr:SPW repeat protein [Candidatus Udaeobacter sp.]
MSPVRDRNAGDGRPKSQVLRKEGKMDNRPIISGGTFQETNAGASWVNVLLGIWVILSPFVVQFARLPAAMWNNVIVGILIALLALIRTSMPRQSGWSWANVIVGIWMIISPFALGVMTTAILWNNIILGIVIALVAAGNASARTPAPV